MTVKEFYNTISGDYEDVIYRLDSENIVNKFLKRLPKEILLEQLEKEIVSGNQKEAFKLAVTLKGTCLNMGLGILEESTKQLTEALRVGMNPQIPSLFKTVKKDYVVVIKAIEDLDILVD